MNEQLLPLVFDFDDPAMLGLDEEQDFALEGFQYKTDTSIKTMLMEKHHVVIDEKMSRSIMMFCRAFETRGEHAEALNSPFLGLKKINFVRSDREWIFELAGTTEKEFRSDLKSCAGITPKFKVASDPFNMMMVWLAHLAMTAPKLKARNQGVETAIILLKLLYYKFFTSLVQHRFGYGANHDIMQKTIEGLSGKYDIKKPDTSTWYLVVNSRARGTVDPNSGIHYKTLLNFTPDKAVTYVISDAQTRLRSQINGINSAYHDTRDVGDRIRSYGLSTEIEGEQVIKAIDATFDKMLSEMSGMVLSVDRLVDIADIKLVSKMTKTVREDMLRQFLIKFSDMASNQVKNGEQDKELNFKSRTTGEDNGTIYLGYRALMGALIKYTYAALVRARIPMNNRVAILENTINLYRSSRSNDAGIMAVKVSVEALLDEYNITQRLATKSSLKIAFVVYMILRTFRTI